MLLLAVLARAQPTKQTIVSPQINADNTVTFRLKAPTAASVKLKGSWMKDNEAPLALTKTDSIWSFTTSRLAPDFYRYNFYLEGVELLDPANSYAERAGTRYESIFIIGGPSSLYTIKAVPHGTISAVWYPSPTLGMNRRMMVYTPPSYLENTTKKYPVLYLLHGAGGDEYAWIARGPVGAVLDNLIAAGKAKEMIVVVTNGYPGQIASPNAGPVNSNPQAGVNNMGNGRFEKSLVSEVMPFIEKRYRVYTDKNNRAIAGFSMGRLQTQHITNANPNLFAYIGVMSMGLQDNNRLHIFNQEEYDHQLNALVKAKPKLYWIGTGKEDFLYSSVVNLRKKYDEVGLHYEYRETEGGHTWSNWSLYLSELVPKLFQ
ncbi:esterase [Hymenobacter sp. GOD-10R]|uniref:esterase n=1 Tax=Hymenobacter sp. GOD-10R TaxID=3093922 RepID=UPI002D77E927|nr:alpha/beta hydrolase-fold protein [Hymenobacter sp. GOD-10R]WRQ31125.1 alpha/beta hydrolase-fold protein [Hymenobacter sp. GOD-10R]